MPKFPNIFIDVQAFWGWLAFEAACRKVSWPSHAPTQSEVSRQREQSAKLRDLRWDAFACAVFVGEVDEGKVVGFHNWIQYYLEERAQRVNYLGYLLPRGRSVACSLIKSADTL